MNRGEPVGQAGYFEVEPMLRRIVDSQSVVLNRRAADPSQVDFRPSHESRSALKEFMRERGIADE